MSFQILGQLRDLETQNVKGQPVRKMGFGKKLALCKLLFSFVFKV